jgi:hypothetical protein
MKPPALLPRNTLPLAAIDLARWFDAKQWKQRHDEIESAHAPCG